MIEHPRLEHQLISLERKVTRGGRDTIDHIRGGHDDIANAVAGAIVAAQEAGEVVPLLNLQAHAINDYDPFDFDRRERSSGGLQVRALD